MDFLVRGLGATDDIRGHKYQAYMGTDSAEILRSLLRKFSVRFTMVQTIKVSSHYIPPVNSSSPALAIQVTSLVDSYMIWAGIAEGNAEDVHSAASQGRLTQEWACAMPSLKKVHVIPCYSRLYRISSWSGYT